jgi:large subunit ribosomal protein L15
MADETPGLTLHELKPAPGSHRERKRIGRGHGSGSGKTAGRGQKGQKARSGSHSMRPGFEGGQMPLYMRLGKLRGPNHKKSMPMGPFRTRTTPVNVAALERFDEGVEVTPDLLRSAGVVRTLKHPIKILAKGELSTRLTVTAHAFSKRAVEVIEAAPPSGLTALRRLPSRSRSRRPRRSARPRPRPPSRSPKRPSLSPSRPSRSRPRPRLTPRSRPCFRTS